jgi:hypothetical protein|tara:strand:+ start:519 stop:875 length:357 start_codon:yes stop_codon:yes gene_type:complete
LSCKGDEKLRSSISIVYKTHLNPEVEISKFAYKEHASSDEALSIRYILNFYEYLAVGINNKVYDESILKESMYTSLINVYERCESFIDVIRKNGQKTAFCNFEGLAKNWVSKPLKSNK